jgi:hypothetical protein
MDFISYGEIWQKDIGEKWIILEVKDEQITVF